MLGRRRAAAALGEAHRQLEEEHRKLEAAAEQARLHDERVHRLQATIVRLATHPAIASGDLEGAARLITESTAAAMQVERVSVWLLDRAGDTLTCVDSFCESTGSHESGQLLAAGKYPAYIAAHETNRVIDAHDARQDPRTRELLDYMQPLGITSMLDSAVRISGQVAGLVSFEHVGDCRTWLPEETLFASEVADQFGQAIAKRQRRQSEEAVRQSEDRYRAFIANSTEGIIRVELEEPIPLDLPVEEIIDRVYRLGYIAEANDAAARIRGFDNAGEVLGRLVSELRRRWDPLTMKEDRRAVESRFQVVDLDTFALDRYGNRVQVLSNLTGVIEDGRLVRVWLVQRDVTKQRLAEAAERASGQRFVDLVNTIDGIVWAAEPDLVRFTFISEQGARLLGYPVERWITEPAFWADHIHPDDRECAVQFCRDATARGLDHEFEYRMIAADGRIVWLRDIRTVRTEAGRAVSLQGVMVDVTKTKRLEQRLRALTARQLAIREEERTRISRETHDELGQQLTVLRFGLSRLRSPSNSPPEIPSPIEDLIRGVDASMKTVRRIATELRPVVLDQFGLVAAIENHVAEFQKRTGIRCHCRNLEEMEMANDSSTTVFRIVQESLTNVARHSGASGVEVSLRREGAELVLSIHDNGRGITEEEATGMNSLGILGMTERARIARGAIRFTGAPGQGTTVVARFPIPALATNTRAV